MQSGAERRLRHRELLGGGAGRLGPADLVAALLAQGGVPRPGALGRRLLAHFGSLPALGFAEPEELLACRELGPASAARLIACFELGRQAALARVPDRCAILGPAEVAALFAPRMGGLKQEQFRVLLLDSKHRVQREVLVAMGGLNAAVVHPREVLRPAILSASAAMVMAHNHPSGDPEPSEEDLRLTVRFAEACRLMGIELLDHVILGGGEFVSLRERGLMP